MLLPAVKTRIYGLRERSFGGLARSTAAVFFWNALRLLAQLIWIVLIARALGVTGYGTFSGVAGIAIAISGMSGLGQGLRMYQDVARDANVFHERWAQSTRALTWSVIPLAGSFLLISRVVLPDISFQLVLALAVSEVMLAPVIHQMASAYAAHQCMSRAAALPVILSAARVVAALGFGMLQDDAGPATYGWLHALSSAVAVALALAMYRSDFGAIGTGKRLTWTALIQGLGFTPLWVSRLAQGNLDKGIALRVGGGGAAGEYSAAHRFSTLAAMPVEALVAAAMPRLFKAGAGQGHSKRLMASLIFTTLCYGVAAGGVLFLLAPLLPLVLGQAFESAVPVATLLAWYVPVYCIRILGANVLLGYGWKRWRIGTEAIGLASQVALMLAWIPTFGALGAAFALLAAEMLVAVLSWWKIGMTLRR
ncbi:lipopolysaccharide biosynthesis protein [Luteimonas sp. A649]